MRTRSSTTRIAVSSQAAMAIAAASPLSPSGPTSRFATTMFDPDGDEGRRDGRPRVLEGVEGPRQDRDQRVRRQAEQEHGEARGRRLDGRLADVRDAEQQAHEVLRHDDAQGGDADHRVGEDREATPQEPRERCSCASRRLPRERGQHHDPQRDAEHADRDLEHREREREDRQRLGSEGRGEARHHEEHDLRRAEADRPRDHQHEREPRLVVAHVDPRPEPRPEPRDRRQLDGEMAEARPSTTPYARPGMPNAGTRNSAPAMMPRL